MNSELKAFVDAERKRVLEPGPHFAARVLAHLKDGTLARPAGIWDFVPGAARPVFGLALMLIFAFLFIQSVVPAAPRSASTVDDNLYVGAEMLTTDEAFAELIPPEGGL